MKYFVDFCVVLFGVCLCQILNAYVADSLVISAAFTGLIATVIFSKSNRFQQLAYCGSFIGMSSQLFIFKWLLSFCCVAFAVLVFRLSSRYFVGFGGKLGAIAFISCLLGYSWIQ